MGNQCRKPGSLLAFASSASLAVYPSDRYTAHSFRIGAEATVSLKAPVLTLKAMGRWSLAAYERYLRPEMQAIISAEKAMCL